jgi:hypothetical protein
MRFSITLATASLLSLAAANVQLGAIPITKLFARADITCESGDIVCGETCIPESYTCCPDKLGGCKADELCQKGDNDEYGCCPEGEICSGDGGAEFIDEKASTTSTASSSSATGSSSDEQKASGAGALRVGSVVVAVAAAVALL